jgi:hypothetical protein
VVNTLFNALVNSSIDFAELDFLASNYPLVAVAVQSRDDKWQASLKPVYLRLWVN